MNSAKKIMNQQNDDKKKSNHASAAKGNSKLSDGGVSDVKKIVISAICILIVLVLCIGVGIQQLKPEVVMQVNDTKFTLDDMMYPIYERESTYLPYDEMYQMYTGSSVWDNNYMGSDRNIDASSTNAVGLKQEILNVETQYVVLYDKAKEAGYSLTDEDKEKVKTQVSDALKGLSWGQRLKLNISKGKLTKRFEKRVLVDKFQADKIKEINATVDEKAAVKDVSKEDYREYKIQYYSVSTSDTTDDEGNTKKLSAKEKKELVEKLEKVAKKAKTEKDFTKLIEEDEEDVKYADNSFTEKDGWSMLSDKKLLKQVKAMKNNTISGIIEDKKSGNYVLVKMIDNNSPDSYDEECDTAIENARNNAYDAWYQEVMTNYDVKTMDAWEEIEIGTVTTGIVTAEDLERMQEDSSDATSN